GRWRRSEDWIRSQSDLGRAGKSDVVFKEGIVIVAIDGGNAVVARARGVDNRYTLFHSVAPPRNNSVHIVSGGHGGIVKVREIAIRGLIAGDIGQSSSGGQLQTAGGQASATLADVFDHHFHSGTQALLDFRSLGQQESGVDPG